MKDSYLYFIITIFILLMFVVLSTQCNRSSVEKYKIGGCLNCQGDGGFGISGWGKGYYLGGGYPFRQGMYGSWRPVNNTLSNELKYTNEYDYRGADCIEVGKNEPCDIYNPVRMELDVDGDGKNMLYRCCSQVQTI